MTTVKLDDVTMIYPFVEVNGLFNRKAKKEALKKQMEMPYTSNEGVVAVQHINFEIKEGEFVVILGPSGSGKSTILRLIAGLERPVLGDIYFDNEIYSDVKPEDRDVAMVFQNYSLYPNQNVYENIAFPLQNLHTPRDEIDKKVYEIADLLNLENKLNCLPDELSGGEKQRVAIARALVRRPKLFLLDEPFANLDVLLKASLRQEIKEIQKKLGIAFVYVTHDQNEALLLADRIIILKDGILQQDDNVSNIYNYPVNLFCGKFIGSPTMNVFDIVVDKNLSIYILNKKYNLNTKFKKYINKKIYVGIRPTNITISKDGLEAKITKIEIIGPDLLIHTLCQNKEITILEKMNTQNKYNKNQTVYINLNEKYFYYFDEEEKLINS